MAQQIFSDSWHIVSGLHVSLINNVTVQKQYFRGEKWYVIKDAFNNKFFRIKPEAYQFVMRLTTLKSVEEIWEEYLINYPDVTPTQEEVVTLLSQLHINNLLYYKNNPNNDDIFERYLEQKKKILKGKLASFLFVRVPLFDPEVFLRSVQPITNAVFSLKGFFLWLVVVVYGAKIVIENSNSVVQQAQGMLAPGNFIFLYIALFLLKILHEFGHAMMCKKFGGPVHTIGIMFLVFTPLPYMDASSSWSFRNKWHRTLVGSAGMIIELFIAAVSAVVWANTGEGFLHSMSFNLMVIGSVSSLVFNANPLLKFDAYYMLSDVLEIPNLFQRSKEQVYYLVEKYIFDVEKSRSPSTTDKEAFWLVFYAVTSAFYRLIVSIAIIAFVADQMLVMGIIVAVMSFYIWIIKPIFTFIVYLYSSPKLNKNRYKALTISGISFFLLTMLISVTPISYNITAPGVINAQGFTKVYTPLDGYLVNLYKENGDSVLKGEMIAQMKNDELELDILLTKGKIKETQALELKAQNDIADLKPIKSRLKLLEKKLEWYQKKKKSLSIYADMSGKWVAPQLATLEHSFLNKRIVLGTIVPDKVFKFIAVVSQEQAFDLFRDKQLVGEVKLDGVAQKTIGLTNIQVIPYEKHQLPSAALGWAGGGDIQVARDDVSGEKSVEAFFEIRADILNGENDPKLLHNRTGHLRIVLPDVPLGEQIVKSIRQLMQKRYQL